MLIYGILNTENQKIYVGKTCDLKRRKAEHLKKRRHFIGRAIAKYGEQCFRFFILSDGIESEEVLNRLEKYWIAALKTADDRYGYNLTHGGEGARFNDVMRAARSGPLSPMYMLH